MATVLLLRCQVTPQDLAVASRALERAGLRVERTVVHPVPVITAARTLRDSAAVLGAWADTVDAAAAELGAAGVTGHLALVGVEQRDAASSADPGSAAGAVALSR